MKKESRYIIANKFNAKALLAEDKLSKVPHIYNKLLTHIVHIEEVNKLLTQNTNTIISPNFNILS